MQPQQLPASDVEDFTERVDEVTRLIAGLKDGTLPPEYVDRKEQERQASLQAKQAVTSKQEPDNAPQVLHIS